MRVLIIDENVAYLMGCTAVLAEDGHDVIPCCSFDEGRRRLARESFDVLIADVRLGAGDGLHLIALAPPATIKIAMSPVRDPVLSRDAAQAGARFVVKPSNAASVSALLAHQSV